MNNRIYFVLNTVFLPEKSHGQRSLVGYSLWCCQESDMTERLNNRNNKYCVRLVKTSNLHKISACIFTE